MFACAISGYSQIKSLAKSKQVAKKTNDLTVCDRTLLSETVTIPLSDLTEELQIIKLDDADAALVKETEVEISDNYILIKGDREIPYKLFDKKTGKFLNNIGSFGQGPNEYQNVYDQQIDEVNNRIYLLPWQAKKILVYDLKGKVLDPIPLCNQAPKGKFKVNTKAATVIVSVLPFTGVPAVVWQQTTDGQLLKSIAPGHIALTPDFSNEVYAFKTDNNYDFHIFSFVPRVDSLYRYNPIQNKLIPLFTLDFKNRERTIHNYSELPNYYMGDLAEPKKISKNRTITQNQRDYIIDKKTLKGSFFKLENDFLGNVEITYPTYRFSSEYYVRNVDPGNLKDELEKTLNSGQKLTPELRAKLTKLKNSITDNDNNYILYAKLKK
ncbi:hypothetical protein FACS189432_02250 [Bacteroidia bacterium]|nr:hypothetical protein FACS189426_18480 [Bacteroidia bacterium]GHT26900.1 hypothetical protein FACS189432_02250 [Bacteroidia bacterium]